MEKLTSEWATRCTGGGWSIWLHILNLRKGPWVSLKSVERSRGTHKDSVAPSALEEGEESVEATAVSA